MSSESTKKPVRTCDSTEQAQFGHIDRFEAAEVQPQPDYVSRVKAVQAMERMIERLKASESRSCAKMRNISLSDMIELMK